MQCQFDEELNLLRPKLRESLSHIGVAVVIAIIRQLLKVIGNPCYFVRCEIHPTLL